MKDAEDEAFDDIERRQSGFQAKRQMAADKLQEPAREALNVSATVFVYRHYKDKTIKAEYYSEAKLLEDSADWEHIATINPRMWIEYHYAEVEALTQDVPETGFGDMAQPAQEPVACVMGTYGGMFVVAPLNPAMVLPVGMALYATPQHTATWVDLTDEEIDVIYEQHHNQYGECESPNFGYERAIEAKLKEKNT
jgi:hypothetical protein